MELEALLAAMDLDPGPADGTLDAATEAAIRSFQEMAGLPADGKATPALLAEVRAVAKQLGITVKSGG
jgi:membrane-bound lytic murein transglycosylase B